MNPAVHLLALRPCRNHELCALALENSLIAKLPSAYILECMLSLTFVIVAIR
jgi:hypothetical protein